ncbi:peptide-methionine (R)-S-oxide reductase MsrB [Pseudoalteromonas sp. JBTF-M23]|uniref:Peptide methionine sulfoxide reductase MsrB n=1 Tax=Pseudoalteromonas caenipelagi TaxID=2726988 RepID=A0A849VGD3_9GAMM|nr:peptide-methionine (R)-S-oxide reductase MsrB [Pseudoalteromonas caenipelagi]NOU52482.1 peptide-methionine (R)-S-oxide reductase MsrB [Pseudoalteromonas caenipelagi]
MLKWKDILNFAQTGNPEPAYKVEKSPEQWRTELNEEVYYITRKKGTERPFSSASCSLFEPGEYACVCCNNLLFDAREKFESGSGWPSFTQPVQKNAIAYVEDCSAGMQRIEIICNVCDAHLGHVFPDGPPPSGLRYCVNALSMAKL